MMIPEGTREQQQCLNEIARLSTPKENAVTIRNALYRIDVVSQAQQLRVPTLVSIPAATHPEADAAIQRDGAAVAEGTLVEQPGSRYAKSG